MGNRNWMRAREALLDSDLIPGDLERLFPICTPGASDSASFDEVLELLHLGGRSLPHAVLMMIPEAWENHAEMDAQAPRVLRVPLRADGAVGRPGLRGLHRRHPDRRGARPQRPAPLALLGHRRRPGRAGLRGRRARPRPGHDRPQGPAAAGPDVPGRHRRAPHHRGRGDQGRARRRAPVRRVAARRPDPPRRPPRARAHRAHARLGDPAPADLRLHRGGAARPAHADGQHRRRADRLDGHRHPDRGAVSDKPRLLFDYFSQLFAQVTNPPLDAIREELVTSLSGTHRPRGQPARARRPASCRQVVLPFPVIANDELAKIRHINRDGDMPGFVTHVVPRPLRRRGRRRGAGARGSTRSAPRSSEAIAGGARIIVLSDRHSTAELAPIPSLLLTGAVHHHLVREKTRTQVGLLVEAGDVREVHHVALLIGYGAAAVNPYLAMESVEDLARDGLLRQGRAREGRQQPDQGARQGRAQGDVQDGRLDRRVLHRRADLRGGRPVAGGRRPLLHRHHLQARRRRARRRSPRRSPGGTRTAYPRGGIAPAHRELEIGGEYQWRREGEPHLFDPETVFRLQHSTRTGPLRHLQAVHRARRRAVRAADDAARAVPVQGRRRHRPRADPDRRGRAGLRDRQAVLDRRDVLRLDQPGGARDARDRDEPARRQVQHRRGRRGRRPAPRPGAAQRDQAGRVRPVRRDHRSTSPTPTTSRSRWPRAPSPARAVSCPATRSTRGWRRPGTPRRASA